MKTKVFCIGFHKTGTTSLEIALKKLGFRVTGSFGTKDPDISEKAQRLAFEKALEYDAFEDNPWPILYQELDQQFPNSKFIMTRRSSESWIRSQVRDFGRSETPMRQWIYGVGCPQGNEDIFVARYERHNREVLAYFKDRSDDLLIFELPKGDGWAELCPFLGHDIPDEPFPHANKVSWSRKIKNIFRR